MALDRGIIDQQLQALGEGSQWWNERELRDLPAVLHADEQILALARGKVGRPRWVRRSWLIVVTDRRLLCMRSSATTWRQFEVSATQITRVALRIGPFRGRVLIGTSGHTYRLLLPRTDAYRIQAALGRLDTSNRVAISGFAATRVVRRVVDHMLALPAIALDPLAPAPPPPPPVDTLALDRRVQELESEMQQLQQQVEFLEALLQQRQLEAGAGAALPPGPPESY